MILSQKFDQVRIPSFKNGCSGNFLLVSAAIVLEFFKNFLKNSDGPQTILFVLVDFSAKKFILNSMKLKVPALKSLKNKSEVGFNNDFVAVFKSGSA